MKKTAISLIAAFVVLLGLTAGEARATLYNCQYLLGITSGYTLTGGPWLTAEFTTITTGEVQLKLQSNLASGYYIQQLAFNSADGVLNSLTFSYTAEQIDGIGKKLDSKKLNGGGNLTKGFDVLINFVTGNDDNRFDGTETVFLTIKGDGITADSFAFLNTEATANVATKIAGNGLSAEASNVPIPAAAWLLTSGLIGLAGWRRKIQK